MNGKNALEKGIYPGNNGRRMRYIVKLIKEQDGSYSVLVPSLPGCVSRGDTREEALKNVKEAIQLHVEGLKEKDWPVPNDEELVEIDA